MISLLLNVFLTCLQGTGGILFFGLFQRRRKNTLAFWGTFFSLTAVFSLALNLIPFPFAALRVGFALAGFFALNYVLFQGKLLFRILIVILFYGCLNIFETVWTLVMIEVLTRAIGPFFSPISFYIFCAVGAELFFMALCLVLKKFLPFHREQKAGGALWIVPLLLAVGSLAFILYLLVLLTDYPPEGYMFITIFAVCTIFLICTNLLVIAIIDWISRAIRAREEAVVLQERLRSQAESLDALSAAYAAQRKMTHDFNAHLLALSGFLSENQATKAGSYLQDLMGQQTERIFVVNTHNAAMDALLNQKAFTAKKSEIDLHFVVNDLSGVVIRTSDLSVIVGNALDNAIEASLKLPVEKRMIEVRMVLEAEHLLFCVRNRSLPVKIRDGMIASTKTNASAHGYGLANIRTILSRYPHAYDLTYDDGWVQFLVDLPNELL